MGYVLGIDLGTTFSAAAVGRDGRAEIFPLGNRAPAIPSVVVLREDGEVLAGEAAERRALSEPTRTGREFKRRLGDPVPLLLGGTPYGAETLTAHLLSSIVAKVVEQQGEYPDRIVLTHPANYGPYKLDLLQQAVRMIELGSVMFISEPEAAAVHYTRQERVERGELVAVYDFGGGTFDAAVLRRTDDGFASVGVPEGLERLGGIDFDQAVFAHVTQVVGVALDGLDPSDPSVIAAVSRLREECRAAKEALSLDTDAQIAVMLPNIQTEVRITRGEFEAMIRPRIVETIDALARAIRSADLTNEDIANVLLVGGSSRIPLVAQMVRESTGRPVAIDAHPKFAIAVGAALVGMNETDKTQQLATTALPEPIATSLPAPARELVAPADGKSASGRRGAFIAAGIALVALAALGVWLVTKPAGDTATVAGRGSATTTTTAASENATSSSSTEGPASSTTPKTTTSSTSPTVTTSVPGLGVLGGKLVTIDDVKLISDTYEVAFTAIGFKPDSDPNGFHVRFFFSSGMSPILTGGASEGTPADYAGPSPFTGFGVADRPAGTSFLCSAVVDSQNKPAMMSGNCAALPA